MKIPVLSSSSSHFLSCHLPPIRRPLKPMKQNITTLIIGAALVFAHQVYADVICYNPSTKAITVSGVCAKGTTLINGTNFASLETKGVNYSKCYTQTGQTAGTPSTGQLSLALRCSNAKDVMVDNTFEPSSNNRAEPSLGAKSIIFSGKVPNGMQITSQAIPNSYYSLKASIVCCPQ